MTDVLILDAAQAEKVRGYSPRKSGAALGPVPLKDGRFYLGPEVLDDPAHEDVRDFLGALPREPLEKLPIYTGEEGPPETLSVSAGLRVRSSATRISAF